VVPVPGEEQETNIKGATAASTTAPRRRGLRSQVVLHDEVWESIAAGEIGGETQPGG
jgi:hypothetical protein